MYLVLQNFSTENNVLSISKFLFYIFEKYLESGNTNFDYFLVKVVRIISTAIFNFISRFPVLPNSSNSGTLHQLPPNYQVKPQFLHLCILSNTSQ